MFTRNSVFSKNTELRVNHMPALPPHLNIHPPTIPQSYEWMVLPIIPNLSLEVDCLWFYL